MKTVSLLLALPLLAVQGDYYPLAEGYTWIGKATISQGGKKQEIATTMKVSGRTKIKETECFVVESEVAGVVSKEYLAVEAAGVRLLGGAQRGVEFTYERPVVRLKYPLEKGASWQDRVGQGGAMLEHKTTVLDEEEIQVPAGRFKAFKLRVETSSPAGKIEAHSWYARDVGVVKQWVKHTGERGEFEITIELRSFEKAKK